MAGRNVRESNWTPLNDFFGRYEVEVDLSAKSDSEDRCRHRRMVYTGEIVPEWVQGLPEATDASFPDYTVEETLRLKSAWWERIFSGLKTGGYVDGLSK